MPSTPGYRELPRIPIPRNRVNSVARLVIHRGQVGCAAGGGVRAVFGANPHAGATVVNGSGGGPNPRPFLRRNTYSRKVEEQRARCAGKAWLIQSPHG
jgi:hypothetical protein